MQNNVQVQDNKLNAFANELLKLKKEAESNLSIKDYHHLRKIIWVNRLFLVLGFGTAWIFPNPFSMICIALALSSQWFTVGHHVCHGGYDQVSPVKRYHSHYFAMGWRRYIDWLDWMYPPAWKYEHNILHHFYTNEKIDPDVANNQINHYINPKWPLGVRRLYLYFNICFWKITYYSNNTLKAFHEKKNYDIEKPASEYRKKAVLYCYLPYITIHFLLIPFLFFPLGLTAVYYVLINRLVAEILTNIHTFFTIVTNHTGSDISLQPSHFKNKAEFYINQISSTCNYKTGGFWNDYLHGYLNYQIEHHLFPHLPPSQYVTMQPKVKALCEKYGYLYKQESVFIRSGKTVKVLLSLENQTYPPK